MITKCWPMTEILSAINSHCNSNPFYLSTNKLERLEEFEERSRVRWSPASKQLRFRQRRNSLLLTLSLHKWKKASTRLWSIREMTVIKVRLYSQTVEAVWPLIRHADINSAWPSYIRIHSRVHINWVFLGASVSYFNGTVASPIWGKEDLLPRCFLISGKFATLHCRTLARTHSSTGL